MKHWLLYALLLLPLLATAQDDYYQKQPRPTKQTGRPVYTIVLRDGTELRGEVLRQDSNEVIIRTRNLSEVRLHTDQIIRIEHPGVGEPVETFPNLFPQTMRLAPTAFSAEKGRLYYHNYNLSLSQFEYGITDNWSVGTTFITFFPPAFFSLNTKVSFPVSSRVRLGVNAQYAALRFNDIFFGHVFADLGYLQGIVTTGDRQNNSTFGVGWSVTNGNLSHNVIGTFGLVRKVSPRLTFISENFVLFGRGVNRIIGFAGLLSAGIRFDRRRHAFDVAAYVPLLVERNRGTIITFTPFGSYHLRIGK